MRWPSKLNPRVRDIISSLGVLILFVLLGMVIYRNTFDVPLVFDDIVNIAENNAIRSITDLASLWYYDPSRFLTHYTFALNFYFGQLDVYGFHLVNLLIHLLTTAVCYFFLRSVLEYSSGISPALLERRGWIAVFAALLFLCHPIQTQAVTYISQRSTPLASLCYLSALIGYIRYRKGGGWKDYAWALVFAFAGLFTKPIIITLPLAMVLCEVFFLSNGLPQKKRVWAGLFPFLAMLVIVPALLILWRDKAFDAGNLLSITRESKIFSRSEYLLTQFNVIMTYIRLLFWPVNQKLDYDYPIAESFFTFPTWLSFLFIVGLFYLAVRIYRKHKIVSFGLFWIFLTLSLESSIFPISDVIFEHRLYLPMIGFALIIAYSLVLLTGNRPKRIFVLCSLIIVVLGTLTYRRNEQWRDAVRFYEDMAETFPNKSRIFNNLGNYYAEKKNLDAALKAYQQAFSMARIDQRVGLYNNIANIYSEKGRSPDAIAMLEQALAIDPEYVASYYNLGLIYASSQYKDYSRALVYFNKSLELNPGFARALVAIAGVYTVNEDLPKAKFYLEQAIAVNPGYAAAYQDLGHLYLSQEQYELAQRYYEEALRHNPDLPDVHTNLGNLYLMSGRPELALKEYQKTIELAPDFAGAYKNMGDVLKEQGHASQARPYYEKAFDLFKKENNGLMMEQIQDALRVL